MAPINTQMTKHAMYYFYILLCLSKQNQNQNKKQNRKNKGRSDIHLLPLVCKFSHLEPLRHARKKTRHPSIHRVFFQATISIVI